MSRNNRTVIQSTFRDLRLQNTRRVFYLINSLGIKVNQYPICIYYYQYCEKGFYQYGTKYSVFNWLRKSFSFLCVLLHHFSNDIRINPKREKYKYWKNTEFYISVGRRNKLFHSWFQSLGHVERKPAIDKKVVNLNFLLIYGPVLLLSLILA